jgi:hypothetical protein
MLFASLLLVSIQSAAAFMSIMEGKQVHETISLRAWALNKMPEFKITGLVGMKAQSDGEAFWRGNFAPPPFVTQGLHLLGTQWPDGPCENNDESPEICIVQMGGDAVLGTTCTIFWRATFGDLAQWHSMASGMPSVTNRQVREAVIDQIGRYYRFALQRTDSKEAWFAIGKIAHSIQDSHSKSHTTRVGPALAVRRFSYYGAQNKHSDADMDTNDEFHEGAIKRTTELVGHFKNRANWDTVREWLYQVVYPLDEGAADAFAGGSDARYACPADKLNCKAPTYSTPSRSMEITIVNNLGYDVTYMDHQMAKSGGGCFSCFAENNGQQYPAFKSVLPCDVIKSGESCTWKMESCGVMTGLEAKFQYDARGRKVEIHVRNSYSLLYANIFTITGIGARLDTSRLKGDNAVVTGTLTG